MSEKSGNLIFVGISKKSMILAYLPHYSAIASSLKKQWKQRFFRSFMKKTFFRFFPAMLVFQKWTLRQKLGLYTNSQQNPTSQKKNGTDRRTTGSQLCNVYNSISVTLPIAVTGGLPNLCQVICDPLSKCKNGGLLLENWILQKKSFRVRPITDSWGVYFEIESKNRLSGRGPNLDTDRHFKNSKRIFIRKRSLKN